LNNTFSPHGSYGKKVTKLSENHTDFCCKLNVNGL